MSMAFLICAAITTISALVSLGFSVAALLGAADQTRTLALYACARSTVFAVIGVYAFVSGSVQWLQAAATGMIIVQALDAAIGAAIKDAMKTLGPAGTAIANGAALIFLMLSNS
jgi:hypothetical protein